jgi:hypothetical protein
MVRKLKKWFVPHKENDFRPHLFRTASVVGLLTLVIILFFIASSGPSLLRKTKLTALVLPRVLVDYANQDRLASNYPGLTISPVLQKAAQLKADDMVAKGYFAHKSPEGHSSWYWFQQVGYDFVYAGENLAVNFNESSEVNDAWMNSPSHKANIMNSRFTEIGIATAEGMYQGKPTTFVVQMFGTPAQSKSNIHNSQIISGSLQKSGKTVVDKKQVTSVATSARVLGVQTGDMSESFIVVEDRTAVPQDSRTTMQYSNWIERLLLSPRKVLSVSYAIIASVVLVGLVCVLWIEVKRKKLYLVVVALSLLAIIAVLLYVYRVILFTPLIVG